MLVLERRGGSLTELRTLWLQGATQNCDSEYFYFRLTATGSGQLFVLWAKTCLVSVLSLGISHRRNTV